MENSLRRRTYSATASGSNSRVVTEPSGHAGRINSTLGSSRSFGRLQDGGHWRGESNGRQRGRQGNGSSRMSSYTPSNSEHNSPRFASKARCKVCLTCRCRRIECDGVRPRCGPCQQNPEDDPCEYTNFPSKIKESTTSRPSNLNLRENENSQTLVNDYDTTNYGESSHTYNGSRVYNNRKFDRSNNAVVHVHVHENGSTPLPSRSPETSTDVPLSPSPATSNSTVPKTNNSLTRSEQYAALLLECGIGYPLWKPTPRCTPEAEYVVSIGDVGIISDGLPFNTLFNITQPTDSLANRDGIPEGVHPPCTIQPRWLTVLDRYHQEWTTLIRPENSVSRRRVHNFSGSRVYSFTLTDTHGALLGLPMGSVLKNLERKTEFKERIKKYWRQWYEFSEEQVDLEEHQALYIVTGVEQCSTWAIAVWHHTPGDCSDPASLKLSINESDGSCSWVHSAVRCETQSLPTVEVSEGVDALKQTVFVRGFWINKVGASISGSASPPTPLRGSDGGLDRDDNSGGSGSSRERWSNNPSTKSGHSQSGFGAAPAPGGGHSEDAAPPPVQNLFVDCLSSWDLTPVGQPCEVINRFAIEVVSRIHPTIMNTEYIVFSHDDDWISILDKSGGSFPSKTEIVKRICSKFKFVVDNGAIYTAELLKDDVELVQRKAVQPSSGMVIPVLIEFQGTEWPLAIQNSLPQHVIQAEDSRSAIAFPVRVGSSGSYRKKLTAVPNEYSLGDTTIISRSDERISRKVDQVKPWSLLDHFGKKRRGTVVTERPTATNRGRSSKGQGTGPLSKIIDKGSQYLEDALFSFRSALQYPGTISQTQNYSPSTLPLPLPKSKASKTTSLSRRPPASYALARTGTLPNEERRERIIKSPIPLGLRSFTVVADEVDGDGQTNVQNVMPPSLGRPQSDDLSSGTTPNSKTPYIPTTDRSDRLGYSFWSDDNSSDHAESVEDVGEKEGNSGEKLLSSAFQVQVPAAKFRYTLSWTSEIPLELVEAAGEEEKFLQSVDLKSKPPDIPAAPGVPPQLTKFILNSTRAHSRSAGSGKLRTGSGDEKGDKIKEKVDDGHSIDSTSSTATPAATTGASQNNITVWSRTTTTLVGVNNDKVLPVPSHAVLGHVATSAIKNGVFSSAQTGRYRDKFVTTVYFKPTSS